jgi:cell division ATPase FtsA
MSQLLGRVAGRLGTVGRGRGAARQAQALTALDVGTEFAKALIIGVETGEGGSGGLVRGVGRKRQGLTHMQSGTVTDIDAVVANCAAALDEAEAMAGMRPTAAVIGIAA